MVIRNILDSERFARDEGARSATRRQWRLPPDAVAVGVVARLDPMKGHAVFLQAAARVAREAKQVRFLVVGAGPDAYRRELRRLADDVGLSGRVEWLPGVEDIVPVYSALDVICSASLYGEGFSNALCEGMACGCVGVATDVGDSRDIVAGYGEVVKAGDPEALAAALIAACGRLAVVDRSAMREHILALCGARDVLAGTEAALAQAAGLELPAGTAARLSSDR
jgi:glycosyltransferase involved in cell wall biosynthesis